LLSGVVGERGPQLAGHERRVAGGGEQVIEAGEQLVARGVVERETPPDSGPQGQELRGAKALGQAGVAGKDDAEQLFGIEFFAGENPQLAQHGREGLLRLVDNENRSAAARADVIGPPSAQGLEARPSVVSRQRDGEEVAELAVEVHGATLRVLDGADQGE
jgi:hypothetical protein